GQCQRIERKFGSTQTPQARPGRSYSRGQFGWARWEITRSYRGTSWGRGPLRAFQAEATWTDPIRDLSAFTRCDEQVGEHHAVRFRVCYCAYFCQCAERRL